MGIKWLNVLSLLLFISAFIYKQMTDQVINPAGLIIALVFIALNVVALLKKDPIYKGKENEA